MKINFGKLEGGAHIFPAHVFYNHTDAGGIVYYANYLRIAEEARVAMFDMMCAGDVACRNTLAAGADFVVRKCEVDYFRPAKYGDDLTIESRITEVGKTSLEITQKVWRGEENLVVVKTKIVYVSIAEMKPARVPDFWLEKIKMLNGLA